MFFDLLNRLIYGDIFTSDDEEDEVIDIPSPPPRTDLRRISQTTVSKKYDVDGELRPAYAGCFLLHQ